MPAETVISQEEFIKNTIKLFTYIDKLSL